MTIPFVDLRIQSTQLRRELSQAVEQVIDDAQFVLGDEVAQFERSFADFSGAKHGIGVASGTDALYLSLRALGVGPGDEVITVANTFIATALAIAYTGATPVLVDVNQYDYVIDVELIERAITPRTKAIVPVHLYGQPADMPAILEVAQKYDLPVIQDACQAHGARIGERPVASFGAGACYSFYPSKNLGAFGDGGMVVSNCDKFAERVRLLRNYGQKSKHDYAMLGYNSRLDTLQAAILGVKLRHLESGNERRRAAATRYRELLSGSELTLPPDCLDVTHVYHLFVVQHPRRDELMSHLHQAGVQSGIHYPEPIHRIKLFETVRTVPEGAPVSTRLARRILSLPMYPEVTNADLQRVSDAVLSFSRLALAS